MTFELNLSKEQEHYSRLDTGIGALYVFRMQAKDLLALEEQLDCPIKECEPEKYIRNLAILVCFPEEALTDEQKKPDTPVLSQDDVKRLTLSELDEIARIFVEQNDSLYKKNDTIKYPKNEDKNYTEYLHRLFVIKKQEERSKLFSPFLGLARPVFSAGLSDKIGNTISMGGSLGRAIEIGRFAKQATPFANGALGSVMKSIDQINRATKIKFPGMEPPKSEKLEAIDFAGMEKKREEERREPFNELAKRLDRLIELSERNIEFALQVNETQTGISAEIKSSGNITEKYSKRNFIINIIVALLTALSVSVAIMIFFDASGENRISQDLLIKIAKEMDGVEQQLTEHDALFERNLEMMETLSKINDEHGKRMEQSTDKTKRLEHTQEADVYP